jgi:hypothetical protein
LSHVKVRGAGLQERSGPKRAMPYRSNEDLPPTLQARLPPHAQDIYRVSFNNTWERFADAAPERRSPGRL